MGDSRISTAIKTGMAGAIVAGIGGAFTIYYNTSKQCNIDAANTITSYNRIIGEISNRAFATATAIGNSQTAKELYDKFPKRDYFLSDFKDKKTQELLYLENETAYRIYPYVSIGDGIRQDFDPKSIGILYQLLDNVVPPNDAGFPDYNIAFFKDLIGRYVNLVASQIQEKQSLSPSCAPYQTVSLMFGNSTQIVEKTSAPDSPN